MPAAAFSGADEFIRCCPAAKCAPSSETPRRCARPDPRTSNCNLKAGSCLTPPAGPSRVFCPRWFPPGTAAPPAPVPPYRDPDLPQKSTCARPCPISPRVSRCSGRYRARQDNRSPTAASPSPCCPQRGSTSSAGLQWKNVCVKDDRRSRRLLSVNDERIVRRAVFHNRVSQLLAAQHRLKTRERNVRCDKKHRHRQRHADRRCQMLLLEPQQPSPAGPINRTIAAITAGSRNAANDGPVKSNRCDIDSV